MSRIRSIHPGLFTDEAFMSASPLARLLIMGIWCEAWDDGVFEWKPLTLKARIFPVDNADVVALLSELEGLGFLKPFEDGGKRYGAIRNFRKYQRPKKPNSSGHLPPELADYVGIPEPLEDQSPTGGEKPPQMEDGGGREEEKAEKKETRKGSALPADWTPHEGHFEKAQAKGFSRQFVSDQADAMREWANANRNRAVARKADWNLTFDGWLRREMEKPRPKGDASRTSPIIEKPKHLDRDARGKVYLMRETPEWDAWRDFTGRDRATDSQGGWWFDSQFPVPQLQAAE